MKKGFNAILGCQFLVFALAVQNYVFSVRSLIVGTAFALILLPLLVAQLFGPIIIHLLFKGIRGKIRTEMLLLLSFFGFALFSSLLLIPDRISSPSDYFIVFRTILLFSYLFFSFSMYFGLVSLIDLKNKIDPESHLDLIRATFAGIFVGITYNLVIRTAGLSLNPYLLNLLSMALIIVALSRYYLVSGILNSEVKESFFSEASDCPSDSKKKSKSAFRNLLIFSIMWAVFMMPVNNLELMSYMSAMPHQWTQYIFVLVSIFGIVLGVKAMMLKFLRNDVYATLQSFLPVLTLLSIGLFGLYLFYPPGHLIYMLNYAVAILIFAIIAAVSFLELIFNVEKHQIGYLAFLILFMQIIHVSLRIIMIERHMPYIWTFLLIAVGILQFWNYNSEYRDLIIKLRNNNTEILRNTKEIEDNRNKEGLSDNNEQEKPMKQIENHQNNTINENIGTHERRNE